MELFFSDRKRKKKNFFLSFTCTLFFSFVSCIASPSRLLLLFFSQIRQNTLFFVLFSIYPPPLPSYHSFFRIFFSFSSLILFPSVRPALLPLSHIHFFSFLFFSKIVPKSISDQRLHLSFFSLVALPDFFPRPMFPPSNDVFHTHSF